MSASGKPESTSKENAPADPAQQSWRRTCARLGILVFLLWALALNVPLPKSGSENSFWTRWFQAVEPYTPYAYSEQAGFQFHDVAFADERTGCGVGQGGTILWTNDGGKSWRLANQVSWLHGETKESAPESAAPSNTDLKFSPEMLESPKSQPQPQSQPFPQQQQAPLPKDNQPAAGSRTRGAKSTLRDWEEVMRMADASNESQWIRVGDLPRKVPNTGQAPVKNQAPSQIEIPSKPGSQSTIPNAQAFPYPNAAAQPSTPSPIQAVAPPPSLPGNLISPFPNGPLPAEAALDRVRYTPDGRFAWALAVRDGVLLFSKDRGQSWSGLYLHQTLRRELAIGADSEAYLLSGAVDQPGCYRVSPDGVVTNAPQPLHAPYALVESAAGNILVLGASREARGAMLTSDGQVVNLSSEPLRDGDTVSRLLLAQDGSIIDGIDSQTPRYLSRLGGPADAIAGADPNNIWAYRGAKTFRTGDGGKTWAEARGLESASRIGFNTKLGWALVGKRLLVSNDRGETWHDPRRHTRYPSYASWVLLVIGLGLVAPAFFQPPTLLKPKHEQSIANFYLSDAPLTDAKNASPDLAAMANGISLFLRNENTGAPLVLGICGAWGSGKSSLMNIVHGQLKEARFYPVAFNAWHHEKEQNFLAALLQTIRHQAIPPVFSWHGLAYRVELAQQRFRRRWVYVTFLLGLMALMLGFVTAGGMTGAALDFRDATALFTSLLGYLPLGAAAAPLLALVRMLGAFGIDPGKLAMTAATGGKTADLRDLTSFRHRFAEEFDEVTKALWPKRMVIFIDDLDRCQPDHMMSVLETINFLATSGQCFVVLSMEKRAVLACLAEKLTGWTQQYASVFGEGEPAPTAKDYAELWLEKLVQVEVTVPTLTPEEKQVLAGLQKRQQAAAEAPAVEKIRWKRALAFAVRNAPNSSLAAALLFIAAAAWFGWWKGGQIDKPPKAVQSWHITGKRSVDGTLFDIVATDEKPKGDLPSASPNAAPPLTPERTPATPNLSGANTMNMDLGAPPAPAVASVATVSVQASPRSFAHLWCIGLGLAAVVTACVVALKRLRRFARGVVTDSQDFHQAVAKWWPQIDAGQATPRALKRFVNRLRLYASLVRSPTEPDGEPLVSERAIVGFAVMEETCPIILQRGLAAKSDEATDQVFGNEAPRNELEALGRSTGEAAEVLTELKHSDSSEAVRRLTSAVRS